MDKTCETCRWWKESDLRAPSTKVMEVKLGYCEPVIPLGVEGTYVRTARGLTASDYSCGEHKERPDAD